MIGARPGELSEADASALAEHLVTCAACQARLADAEALSDLLPDALMAEASRRDFSSFSDEVLARIPEYRSAARRERWPGLLGWARRHRALATASALAPTLAALALVVYFSAGGAPERPAVEISSEGRTTMVLETRDGPVVLLGDDEPEGS